MTSIRTDLRRKTQNYRFEMAAAVGIIHIKIRALEPSRRRSTFLLRFSDEYTNVAIKDLSARKKEIQSLIVLP